MVLDEKFAFGKRGDILPQVLHFSLVQPIEVAQYAVVDGLLFHDEWVLGVGIEVEVFAAVAVHALGGKDDTHSFVSSYGYEVSQRLVVETEHIVRFVVEVFQIIELVIDVLVTLKKTSGVPTIEDTARLGVWDSVRSAGQG